MPKPNNEFSQELEDAVKPLYEKYVHYCRETKGWFTCASFLEIMIFCYVNNIVKSKERR